MLQIWNTVINVNNVSENQAYPSLSRHGTYQGLPTTGYVISWLEGRDMHEVTYCKERPCTKVFVDKFTNNLQLF